MLIGIPEGKRDHLENLGEDGWIILIWILGRWSVRVGGGWIVFNDRLQIHLPYC